MVDRLDVAVWNWNRPVFAAVAIQQSPLSDAPDVPVRTMGWLQDIADDLLWIDFGGPFGVVACAQNEVTQ